MMTLGVVMAKISPLGKKVWGIDQCALYGSLTTYRSFPPIYSILPLDCAKKQVQKHCHKICLGVKNEKQ